MDVQKLSDSLMSKENVENIRDIFLNEKKNVETWILKTAESSFLMPVDECILQNHETF